jgi:hypothetical protein
LYLSRNGDANDSRRVPSEQEVAIEEVYIDSWEPLSEPRGFGPHSLPTDESVIVGQIATANSLIERFMNSE